MTKAELLDICLRPASAKGRIHVYRDERSGHPVIRFMLHKKRRKKHLLTMPLAEFRRLSAVVLARLDIAERNLKSVSGGGP